MKSHGRNVLLGMLSLTFVAVLAASAGARGIENNYPTGNGSRRPTVMYEENRTIAGHRGAAETLSFRLALYGAPAANLPVLVQVHEWGGDFRRQESIAAYEPSQYAFVMLYFQYSPASGNEDDWWFGTGWNGQTRMWAADAVAAIVAEAQQPGWVGARLNSVAVDPARFYLFGHSIGGTGAWQIGLRHPELFAAFHSHAGFARFTGPSGPFQGQFDRLITGTAAEAWTLTRGLVTWPARDYSNLSWWLQNVHGNGSDTPFAFITHGTADDAVPIASGGDLMQPVLDAQQRGFSYLRVSGGHSVETFVRLNWMWNFRRDRSFLAFTQRRGFGAAPGAVGRINDLAALSWDPDTLVDTADRYEVTLVGSGTADVTLRRLQALPHAPGQRYLLRVDNPAAAGTLIVADADGRVTLPAMSGGHRLLLTRDGAVAPPPPAPPTAAPPPPAPPTAAPPPPAPPTAAPPPAPVPGVDTTTRLQRGLGGSTAVADTFLSRITTTSVPESTGNFGGASVVRTYETGTRVALFRFDLSALPRNAVIISATFEVYAERIDYRNAPSWDLYRLTQGFVEGTCVSQYGCVANGATFASRGPGLGNWTTAGGTVGERIGRGALVAGAVNEFDLRDAVQQWVAGTWANNGLLARGLSNYANDVLVRASESADAATRPALEIVWRVPAP